MAVIGRRDLRLTRDQVHEWLAERNAMSRKPNMRKFLETKLNAEGHGDTMIDMGEHGHLSVLDVLMEDIDSYA